MMKAVTFDLWDTIVFDDSDEPKRRARGLRSKHDERRYLVWEALNRHAPISREAVDLAYDVGAAAFNAVWHDQHVTWTIAARLAVVLKGLGRTLPEDDLAGVIRAHETMEVEIFPDLIPGCGQALAELSQRFKLAVVSDAIVTPGSRLRDLLELHGVRQYFSALAFSDEVGQLGRASCRERV
ncbi:MAG: hypothetical protein BMS9Abin04_231 [Planctomycetia bacterium]|nr:MAG: hypothetical protein BMS9Abin04_231 [Planctomycetia bacterium]